MYRLFILKSSNNNRFNNFKPIVIYERLLTNFKVIKNRT
jgi:hypothetical protein